MIEAHPPGNRPIRMLIAIAESVIVTLIVFVLLQTFVGRTYAVEQTSMQPTLEPAERLIVDRLTPRFDPYKRGDIVVFDPPAMAASPAPMIKRVIAIEGSTVELLDGRVYVDGIELDEPYVFEGEQTLATSGITRWVVPPGHLFLLGDHRTQSHDSRAFGPIHDESVIGRAWLRFFPFDDAALLSTDVSPR
jgi:signal peptidase I